MESQPGNIPMDKPQFVETSNKTARYSLFFGVTFLIFFLSWNILLFQPAFDEYAYITRIMNFSSMSLLSFLYFQFYFSYSKPNLMLHWDRLGIQSFQSKGAIMLTDVVKVTTGYRIKHWIIRKNQTMCLNDMNTWKNKVLIKTKIPVPFLLPFGRTKFVDEIIVDVLDPDRFAWNLYMRNPEITFEHSPQVIKTYESPTPLVELRARI